MQLLICGEFDQGHIGVVVMFFRFITSGEMRKRSDFFEPFIFGTSNMTVQQVQSDN